jgi:hypothetical protein
MAEFWANAGTRAMWLLRLLVFWRLADGGWAAESAIPLAWIAERLAMGSRSYLAWLLYPRDKML